MAWIRAMGGGGSPTPVVPDGKTVTPINDVTIWQKCAGIANPTYTTLADVLADTSISSTLMASDNAVDYLVRSTTFASTVCANSNAMTYIGQSNYASDTLLVDNDWFTAICDSSYFENVLNAKVPDMTGYSTPSGTAFASSDFSGAEAWRAFNDSGDWCVYLVEEAYIGYTFTTEMKIYKVYLQNRNDQESPKNCKLQYKDGNNTWQDVPNGAFVGVNGALATKTQNIYQSAPCVSSSWRLYISSTYVSGRTAPTLHRLQFYGREDV